MKPKLDWKIRNAILPMTIVKNLNDSVSVALYGQFGRIRKKIAVLRPLESIEVVGDMKLSAKALSKKKRTKVIVEILSF